MAPRKFDDCMGRAYEYGHSICMACGAAVSCAMRMDEAGLRNELPHGKKLALLENKMKEVFDELRTYMVIQAEDMGLEEEVDRMRAERDACLIRETELFDALNTLVVRNVSGIVLNEELKSLLERYDIR
jgi:hypothetical protein